MQTTEAGKERRRHTRYNVASGGFALLRANDAEVLGRIRDISAGGLSLLHIDDDEAIHEHSSLVVNLISEKICSEKFNGKSVWCKKEKSNFATATVKMKSCGVAFEQLNEDMQTRLSEFIDSLEKK